MRIEVSNEQLKILWAIGRGKETEVSNTAAGELKRLGMVQLTHRKLTLTEAGFEALSDAYDKGLLKNLLS